MPASPPILAIGVLGTLLVFFLAWRRPTVALTVWLIFSTVFSEYVLLPNAPTLHVHLSRALLTALVLGLAAGWVPLEGKGQRAPVAPAVLIVILTVWTIFSALLRPLFSPLPACLAASLRAAHGSAQLHDLHRIL